MNAEVLRIAVKFEKSVGDIIYKCPVVLICFTDIYLKVAIHKKI